MPPTLLVGFNISCGYIPSREIPIRTNIRKRIWTNPGWRGRISVVARIGDFQRIFDDSFVPNEASAKDLIPIMETREM